MAAYPQPGYPPQPAYVVGAYPSQTMYVAAPGYPPAPGYHVPGYPAPGYPAPPAPYQPPAYGTTTPTAILPPVSNRPPSKPADNSGAAGSPSHASYGSHGSHDAHRSHGAHGSHGSGGHHSEGTNYALEHEDSNLAQQKQQAQMYSSAGADQPQEESGRSCCARDSGATAPGAPRKLTKFEKLVIIGGVVVTIVSIVMAVLSYATWSTNEAKLDDIVNNWHAVPFQSLHVRAGCLAGEQAVFPNAQLTYTYTDNSGSSSESHTDTWNLRLWRQQVVCGVRNSEYGSALSRPRAEGGLCPAGYMLCGVDDCVSQSVPSCPITSLTIDTTAAGAQDTFTHNGATYYVHTAVTAGARPLTDVTLNLNPRRQFCVGMVSGSKVQSSCGSGVDTRYTLVDQYGTPLAGGSQETQYYNEAVTNPPAQLITESNDRPASQIRVPSLFQRPEIAWAADCPMSRHKTNDLHTPLQAITKGQMAVLGITVIAGAINLVLSYRMWKERTDDDPSNDDVNARRRFYLGVFTDAVILAVTVVVLAVSESVRSNIHRLASDECSDSVTNGTFTFFSDKISGVTVYNIVLIALRGLWLLYRLFTCMCCNEKVGK